LKRNEETSKESLNRGILARENGEPTRMEKYLKENRRCPERTGKGEERRMKGAWGVKGRRKKVGKKGDRECAGGDGLRRDKKNEWKREAHYAGREKPSFHSLVFRRPPNSPSRPLYRSGFMTVDPDLYH